MSHDIVVIDAGFAGVWSALSAKRLIKLANRNDDVKVLVSASKPFLVTRPPLY